MALQGRRPPNVVFILADDLGWGDLACYGNPVIRTPNLDRLGAQGALFTQFYVSNPVCSPSRTGFMTGHFPARHRVHGHFADAQINARRGMPNWLDPGVVTLPRLLKNAGYATGHFGKWHLGSGPGAPNPDAYGIDDQRTFVSNGPGFPDQGPDRHARLTERIVDEAVRFIGQHQQHPFYLNVWTSLVHAILDPTDEQLKAYERFRPNDVRDRGATAIYYASVTELDKQVGRVMKKLDEAGIADNTIVVFSSDNGPEDIHIANASHSAAGSPGPFRGRKRSLYEGGVRLPFIVRWPGHVAAGRTDTTSVLTAVDFLPTICKLADVAVPPNWKLDGEDTSDILLRQSRPRTKPIYWEWRFNIAGYKVNRSPMIAVREGNWKLLLNPDRSRVELYDIPRDPSETTNLAERERGVVQRMSEMALAWQKTLPEGPRDPGAGHDDWRWPQASAGTKP
jgi:N-acetylgalactosamine-6-sulfatase